MKYSSTYPSKISHDVSIKSDFLCFLVCLNELNPCAFVLQSLTIILVAPTTLMFFNYTFHQ